MNTSQRIRRYLKRAADFFAQRYHADGSWISKATKPPQTRERYWACFALYANDYAELADAVIRPTQSHTLGVDGFNIFSTNIATALLFEHEQSMADDVREKLRTLVARGLEPTGSNRSPDYQFHGYNDNMPAKATMGMILGGELLNHQAGFEHGLWNLRQFAALLARRGVQHEWNSPTYTPLTIHAISTIAQHTQSDEVRSLALAIEHRLWIDLAARFHPELGVVSGPYSRAYAADLVVHVSSVSQMLSFVLGDVAKPSAEFIFEKDEISTLETRDQTVVHHHGDIAFNIASGCWFASGHYHLPEQADALFKQRNYPYRVVATTEMGNVNAEFVARSGLIQTHLERDFALGTTTTGLCGGEQTADYFVTYKRRQSIERTFDVGTVFYKMLLDDEQPGQWQQAMDSDTDQRYQHGGEKDYVTSYANTFAVQDSACALLLSSPHLALAGIKEQEQSECIMPAKSICRLSEAVVFGCHNGYEVDELVINGKSQDRWAGEVPRGAWIVCRRGQLLIGIRPLVYTRTLGEPRIILDSNDRYNFIRILFYEGYARTFSVDELRYVIGGFVAEHACADDFESIDAFAGILDTAVFVDYQFTTRRVHYRRPAYQHLASADIEVSRSPNAVTTRYCLVQGQLIDDFTPIQIDGVDAASLPLLNQASTLPDFSSTDGPWASLEVPWQHQPFAVGDTPNQST